MGKREIQHESGVFDAIKSLLTSRLKIRTVLYYENPPVIYQADELVTAGYVDNLAFGDTYPDPIITDVEAGTLIPSDGSENYWTVPYDSSVYGTYPNVKLITLPTLRTFGVSPDVAYVDGEVRIYNLPNNGDPTNLQVLDDTRIVISKA